MNAYMPSKSYDSCDYLLIANSFNVYTDLLITRSLSGMDNTGMPVKLPFGLKPRRSLLNK